jgi:NTE family protein
MFHNALAENIMFLFKKPKVTGLALGSGSARGWAHIGVIRALAEAGVKIDCVAGTSIGSVVGAAYCHGKLDDLEEFARKLDWKSIISFLDITIPRSGLIDGERLTKFFHQQLKLSTIEALPMPYCAVATELATGKERVLKSGDLINAIRASIAIPGILTPASINGMLLSDGGLVNPVPVSAARDLGANYVIAVDLNHDMVVAREPEVFEEQQDENIPETDTLENDHHLSFVDDILKKLNKLGSSAVSNFQQWFQKDPTPNIFEVMSTSINIMEAQITEAQLKIHPPDILIRPRLGHIKIMDFDTAAETIEEGYRATREALKQGKK